MGYWRMGHVGACVTMPQNMSLLCSGWRMGHESTERGFICYSVGGWLCRVGLAQFRIVRFPFAFDVKSHQTFRSWTVACIFKTSAPGIKSVCIMVLITAALRTLLLFPCRVTVPLQPISVCPRS